MSSCTTPALRVKDEKCIFDVFINGINFAHFQAVFYAFFNTAIRANCSTCMVPSWVSYFLPSSISSSKPTIKPSSPPTFTPSTPLSTSFSVDTLLFQTKRATERMERGLFGMMLKKVQYGIKNKKNVIIYNSCITRQR